MATPQISVSSPWGKTTVAVPCSLEDVMSEQLASQIVESETKYVQPIVPRVETTEITASDEDVDMAALLAAAGVQEGDLSSDELIARMLQLEFDREHNAMLDVEQKKYNGTSKVTLSFEKYKSSHPAYEEEDDEEEQEDYVPQKTQWEEPKPKFGTKGYAGSGKNITTKHDKVMCGRKNAERMMEFPPEFVSGDGEGMDMQLPNHVYNRLKVHATTETKRSSRHTEKKDHSTAEHVMDPATRLLLYKMVNNGLLESIGGTIAGGKESIVFQAHGGSIEGKVIPQNIAIKVYKTTLMDFRTREKYVHGDHRFSHDDYKKQNPRKIIKIWAEKEVANLNRMRKFNVPCPSVVMLRKHVLLMSLIGSKTPAPKLKDASLSVTDLQVAYEQTVEIMKTLYNKCMLIHADLSEFNLLWHNDQVWVIDVSQAVDVTHPQALNFLYRDCCNVSSYFEKQDVHGVLSPEQLFNDVTGLEIQGKGADFNAQVQRYDKERKETNIVLDKEYSHYAFDYFFEKSQQERNASQESLSESDREQ